MERAHSRDSGTSFVEIVVSVVILGTVCIGVVTESGQVVRRLDAVVAVPKFTHTVQIDSWKVSS